MSHTSYVGDPKIMFAKFSSVCPKCNKKINKSDRIVYFPNGKKAFCYSCGEQDYLDFISSAIDEDNYNRGYC